MNPTSISLINRGEGSNDIQEITSAISLDYIVTLSAKSDLEKAAHAAFDSCLEFNSG